MSSTRYGARLVWIGLSAAKESLSSTARRHGLSRNQHGALVMMVISHRGLERRNATRAEVNHLAAAAARLTESQAQSVYIGLIGALTAVGGFGENFGESQCDPSLN